MVGVMRRLPQALLFALLLLTVQTVVLSHEHGDSTTSYGAVQGCEFCVGHLAAAPAPDARGATFPDSRSALIPHLRVVPAPPIRAWGAHRSRAPPATRPA